MKSQSGLSMLEMSISMGVLGGVMLISMNVVNQQKSNESYIKSKGEVQKAVSLLAINLKDPENCRSVIAGRKYQKTSSNETRLSNLRIKVKKTKSLITNCTVYPSLPNGLRIDPKSCVIKGTPTTQQEPQNYTVNVTYGNSTTPLTSTFSLLIENPTQNSGQNSGNQDLSFHGSMGTLGGRVGSRWEIKPAKLNLANTSNLTGISYPYSSGTTSQSQGRCSVYPSLPDGLEINSNTCIISGVPKIEFPPTTFTVTLIKNYTKSSARVTLAASNNTTPSTSDSGKSANYKGEVGVDLNISPSIPSPSSGSTASSGNSSSDDEVMEILKPNAKYKDFKTESIDVLQQDTNANNVVDLQVKFRLKNRDASKWNPFDSSSDDDIIITEKIPLIISRDSSNTITDCTAAVSESSATAKEKFCLSLGAAASWDSTTKKCSFSSNAKCSEGKILKKMEGMTVVCEDVKNHINLNELFDESTCSSTGSYRIIESNGRLKVDCNNSVLIAQRVPERDGILPSADNIILDFDHELESSTVNSNNIQVLLETKDSNNNTTYTAVESAVNYSFKKITINPNNNLETGKTYKIQLNGNVKSTGQTPKSINGIESNQYEYWTFVAQ